jgi:lysophospholipase L1-like esterase
MIPAPAARPPASIACAWLLLAVCLLGPRGFGQPADPAVYLAPVVAELAHEWPKNRAITIVCHGHSVPAGYFKTPTVDTFNAYPHLLHRALKARFPFAVINVIVTAIGGENAVKGAARFERDVLPLRPDVVLIDYALNDRGAAPGFGLAAARTAWISMIEKAQAAGAKVILLTPTPDTRVKLDGPADPLRQHAAQVRELAATHHTALVDSLARFDAEVQRGTPLAELMSHVNHPNARGHALVAAAVAEWFPAPPTNR